MPNSPVRKRGTDFREGAPRSFASRHDGARYFVPDYDEPQQAQSATTHSVVPGGLTGEVLGLSCAGSFLTSYTRSEFTASKRRPVVGFDPDYLHQLLNKLEAPGLRYGKGRNAVLNR
jgi:hypothetical protein